MELNTKQFNFTLTQITKLMYMQDELNTYIHPEWKTQDFNWDTAIIDECQEILEHLGWKWWKKGYKHGLTNSNIAQIRLEVIDILHFILSLDIQEGALADNLLTYINHELIVRDIWTATDFMRTDAATGVSTLAGWALLAHSVDLTEQQVLETYTQKYVLNKFRQDHGYKDGSYVKVWDVNINLDFITVTSGGPMEDNEVLAAVVDMMRKAGHDTTDETALYNTLRGLYNSRLGK